MSAVEPVGIASLCAAWNKVKFLSSHCALREESRSSFTGLFFSPYVYLQLFNLVFYVVPTKPSLEIIQAW